MASTDEDLNQLERDIRTLRIEYDQFFAGGRKRPPADTQWRVESIINRYGDRGAEMNYAQRFRYSNLSQTYAKYSEVWRKKLKQKEEGGTQRHFGAAARAIAAERAQAGLGGESAMGASFAMSFSDPDHELPKIEQLYQKLLEARAAAGEKGAAPSYEDFGNFVRQKTSELRTKKGGAQVEYTVSVEGGRVKLKARVNG